MPAQVAQPAGCRQCNDTGYHGREGIYEIMTFDPEIAEMVRGGAPISRIRARARERGDGLMSHHAVEKVGMHLLSARDVYEKVLVEEVASREDGAGEGSDTQASILVVEDDQDTRALIQLLLERRGHQVTVAADGVEALLWLGKKEFDLILSDINMPNFDGFKLLEMKTQKSIETPLIFLTASAVEEAEVRALELGATDYLRKPVNKDVLLLRVKSVLERRTRAKVGNRVRNG